MKSFRVSRVPAALGLMEAPQMMSDELGDDLGVRITPELDTITLELTFESGVVLDDTIVNNSDEIFARDVRVSVAVGRGAMRGPASVTDADLPGNGSPPATGLTRF